MSAQTPTRTADKATGEAAETRKGLFDADALRLLADSVPARPERDLRHVSCETCGDTGWVFRRDSVDGGYEELCDECGGDSRVEYVNE